MAKYPGLVGVPLAQIARLYETVEDAARPLVKDFYERHFAKADGHQKQQFGALMTALNNLGAVLGKEVL